MEHEHDQVPENPIQDQTFECPLCGYKAIWDEEYGWFS